MSDVEAEYILLELAPIAFLGLLLAIGFLALHSCLQNRRQGLYSSRPRNPEEWTGHGIEVGKLKPAVDIVRRDYLVGRASPQGAGYHRLALSFMRRAVVQLAYFHNRRPEETAEEARQ